MGKITKFIDNLLYLILSKNKYFYGLVLLTLTGFIIRVISAINQGVTADDMHFAPGAINFISSGKLIYWDQSSGLWFLITDLFYKIFGTTQLGSRFSAVLFGTLLIPLMFLFTKEFFKKDKPAFFAAALTTFSVFGVKSMMAEMDVMAMFFAIFSMFLFLRALNNNYSRKFLALSGVAMGLAIYTKVYPLLFLPGMICYLLYHQRKEKNSEGDFNWIYFIKLSLWVLIPAFLFCLPALTHNYLLYKDKGIMDHRFTMMFGSNEAKEQYSWVSGNEMKFNPLILLLPGLKYSPEGLPVLVWMIKWFLILDPIIFILGVLGFIVLRKNKKLLLFFGLSALFLIIYMGSMMQLQKHYIFLSLFSIPAAAFFLSKITDNFPKVKFIPIFLIIIVFSFFYLGTGIVGYNIYAKSEIQKLIEYKQDSIPKGALVIVDSRVYRGPIAWIFNDRHYLEASYLSSLASFNSSKTALFDVYYVECARDDCGWGTIKNQPEFNKSMEDLSEQFRNLSKSLYTISSKWDSGIYYIPPMKLQQTPHYIVYKARLSLPQESLLLADSTHTWWMYPIGYDEKIQPIFDKYETTSSLDSLLDKVAHIIRFISIALAFISILLLIYLLVNSLRLSENSKSNIFMSDKVIHQNNRSHNDSGKHLVHHRPIN